MQDHHRSNAKDQPLLMRSLLESLPKNQEMEVQGRTMPTLCFHLDIFAHFWSMNLLYAVSHLIFLTKMVMFRIRRLSAFSFSGTFPLPVYSTNTVM
mmetsp:Transcript_53681/g.114009  ORF Transcript_53681/g.114009 Transcript_53681/m.114009 type:complete len:96 (-) Transcript_53681:81-368(-)